LHAELDHLAPADHHAPHADGNAAGGAVGTGPLAILARVADDAEQVVLGCVGKEATGISEKEV
jgi:hypothetical protein